MNKQEIPETPEDSYSRTGYVAAGDRLLMEAGKSLHAFGDSLRWLKQRPPQIYNIQFRWPIRAQQEVLMMVKAVSEVGPVIAFHSDRTVVTCIISWSSRLSAGRIKWKADDKPPSNYEQIAEHVTKEVEGFAERFGTDL